MSKVWWFVFWGGWSGSILQLRQDIIKVGSKSWLLTCSSNTTLSLPSYTGSALKRELNFCNGYLSLLYFWYISLWGLKTCNQKISESSYQHMFRCLNRLETHKWYLHTKNSSNNINGGISDINTVIIPSANH